MGADRSVVVRSVLGRAVAIAGMGLVGGLLAVVTIGGVLESVLFGVSATDPRIGLGVGVGVMAVALVAAYLPARRAASIAPVAAMRGD